jgi:hypothetical protein
LTKDNPAILLVTIKLPGFKPGCFVRKYDYLVRTNR